MSEAWDEYKAGISKVFDEAAERHGVTKEVIITEMFTGLMMNRMFWHHARRGNVAKTLAWGIAITTVAMNKNARRTHHLLESRR